MNVWMRGRSASLIALHAASMSGLVRARQAADHRALDLARDRLDRLEVAGRGDREAGLDHVDAQARELLGDLELLLRVQRDPGRLLAVAQRRVEDVDPVARAIPSWCSALMRAFLLLASALPIDSLLVLRLSRRPALFPPKGEEKEKREAVEPVASFGRVSSSSASASSGTSTTLPTFLRSAMKRWASAARSNGNASATTGSMRAGVERLAAAARSMRSSLPSCCHSVSMLRPKTPLFSFMIATSA